MPKRHAYELSNSSALFVLVGTAYIASLITTFSMTDVLDKLLPTASISLISVVVFMSGMFVVSRILKRSDVADAVWGPSFIVAAMASFIAGDQSFGFNVQTILLVFVTIWGLRLCTVIIRRLMHHPEDMRYVELRKKWKGNVATNTFGRIFLVQAILATLISMAVIYANASPTASVGIYTYLGSAIWLIGFIFEVVGDAQLKKFLALPKNKGKLMTSGLWRYTRHPNYFGEVMQWCGIFVASWSFMYAWIGSISPLLICYLLLYVSGVPLVEKRFEGRPGWAAYKKRTSKFIPLPPSK